MTQRAVFLTFTSASDMLHAMSLPGQIDPGMPAVRADRGPRKVIAYPYQREKCNGTGYHS